jgi:hypothetical protein
LLLISKHKTGPIKPKIHYFYSSRFLPDSSD